MHCCLASPFVVVWFSLSLWPCSVLPAENSLNRPVMRFLAALSVRRTNPRLFSLQRIYGYIAFRLRGIAREPTDAGDCHGDKPVNCRPIGLNVPALCDRTRLRILSLLRDGETVRGDSPSRSSRFRNRRYPATWLNCAEQGFGSHKPHRPLVHYSWLRRRRPFTAKLPRECAIASFQEVPKSSPTNVRAKATPKLGRLLSLIVIVLSCTLYLQFAVSEIP